MQTKPTLAYWDIRGLAAPIRTLLVHTGVEFEDKQYAHDTIGEKSWEDDKAAMVAGHDYAFPNLPYFTDGSVHISQVRFDVHCHTSTATWHNSKSKATQAVVQSNTTGPSHRALPL